DKRRDTILQWNDTGYEFLRRQSQENQNRWVRLGNPVSAPPAVSAQSPRLLSFRLDFPLARARSARDQVAQSAGEGRSGAAVQAARPSKPVIPAKAGTHSSA